MAGETILIIDDNADVRILLGERVLPSYGYKTLTATDGQEGLWQIRTQKPDLILLDLRLPDMTGLDLLHILSSEGYDTPVILITAYGSELIAAQALRLGVRDYIIKPFTLDEIVEAVERALTERRLRRERNGLTDHLRYCVQALQVLADAGQTLDPTQRQESIFCQLVESAVEATRAQIGRLWLYNPEEKTLFLRAAQDAADQEAYALHRRNDSNEIEDAFAAASPQVWNANERTIITVPVYRHKEPAGLLEMEIRADDLLVDNLALPILQVAATWCSLILNQTHLLEKSRSLERRIEALLALSPNLLLVLDEAGQILSASSALEEMMGQHPEVVIGQDFRRWMQSVGSTQEDLVEGYLNQPTEEEGAERYALFFSGPEGEPRQAEVFVLHQRQEEGLPRRYILLHDVTAHQQLEQEVRLLRRELGETSRSPDLGLFLIDLKGAIVAFNNVAKELLQDPTTSAPGESLWEALAPAEDTHLLPEAIARAHREGFGYAEIRWPEKPFGAWGISLLLLIDSDGSPHAIVGLARPSPTLTHEANPGRPTDESDLLGSEGIDS